MTFIYDLDPYPLKTSPQIRNELYTSRLSKVIVIIMVTYRAPHTSLSGAIQKYTA